MKKKVHIVPRSGSWGIKVEGNKKASAVTSTKKEADAIGREKAKKMKTDLIIHGKDGRIQDSDSFGNDPNPPIDKKH
jgi:hypothetical protein